MSDNNENQQLAQANTGFSLRSWETILKMADTFFRSRALPAGIENVQQLVMILQMGMELGFKPMQSINSIFIVKGKTALSAQAMLSKILEAHVNLEYVIDTPQECKIIFSGLGRKPYTASFTIEEAKNAGLLLKTESPWHKYPKAMLRARATSLGARVFCPDVIQGTYVLEEIADVVIDDQGQEKIAGRTTNALPPVDPLKVLKSKVFNQLTRLGHKVTKETAPIVVKELTGIELKDENLQAILDKLLAIPTPGKDEPPKTQPPAESVATEPSPEAAAGNEIVDAEKIEKIDAAIEDLAASPVKVGLIRTLAKQKFGIETDDVLRLYIADNLDMIVKMDELTDVLATKLYDYFLKVPGVKPVDKVEQPTVTVEAMVEKAGFFDEMDQTHKEPTGDNVE